ncbi:LysB family transcriptional regulator [Pseudomonas sp. 382]|nr:LysB family transcriptional regulator [Pseudomonas sp. 382]
MDLRTGLLTAVLLASLGAWGWSQKSLLDSEKKTSEGLAEQLDTAKADARDNLATANALKATLEREREDQAKLLKLQSELRTGLANRERLIEDLKHENDELRQWADQPLPDAARRLRERPAITGADAYRQWLSSGGALPTASDKPGKERPVAH